MKKTVERFFKWWFSIHSENVSNAEEWLKLEAAGPSEKPLNRERFEG